MPPVVTAADKVAVVPTTLMTVVLAGMTEVFPTGAVTMLPGYRMVPAGTVKVLVALVVVALNTCAVGKLNCVPAAVPEPATTLALIV